MTQDAEPRRRSSNENGATVVEFAVIVLLLLLIIFGILEFAFIFYQRHFIENAAREGMRIGIRADNYETFSVEPGCTNKLNRYCAVEVAVNDYLSTLYPSADDRDVDIDRIVDDNKALKVTVQVNNFFPQLLSGLVPGYVFPATLSYSVTGVYEDPDED